MRVLAGGIIRQMVLRRVRSVQDCRPMRNGRGQVVVQMRVRGAVRQIIIKMVHRVRRVRVFRILKQGQIRKI